MTPDQLRALADALEPMAQAPRFEGFDVPAFCAWVRACADAEPVAWMHDGFMSTDYERVQHDEMRNRSCGFKAKPIIPLYAHPVPAAPQAEPTREPRPCTCHPDDNPPVPCAQKYALNECRATRSGPDEARDALLDFISENGTASEGVQYYLDRYVRAALAAKE